MSEQTTPATRQAVLILHCQAYRLRANVSHERWAEDIDAAYCRLVPPENRGVPAPDLATVTGAEDYRKLLRAWDQVLRRYKDGSMRFPAELEEAWIEALAEPYRTDCKRELAQRVGLWGAVRRADGPAGDGEAWGAVLVDFGDLSPTMCRVLADGAITEADQEAAPEVIRQVERAQADLESLRRRLMGVLEGKSLRSVG